MAHSRPLLLVQLPAHEDRFDLVLADVHPGSGSPSDTACGCIRPGCVHPLQNTTQHPIGDYRCPGPALRSGLPRTLQSQHGRGEDRVMQ